MKWRSLFPPLWPLLVFGFVWFAIFLWSEDQVHVPVNAPAFGGSEELPPCHTAQ